MRPFKLKSWQQTWPAQAERWRAFWQRTQTFWNLGGLAALCCLLVFLNPISVQQVALEQTPEQPLSMPATLPSSPATYRVIAWLEKETFTRPYLALRADDCIEAVWVDEERLFQQVCSSCLHCASFRLPLPADLAEGSHALTIQMQNLGGVGWLDLRQAHGFGWLEALITFNLALVWLLWFDQRKAWWSWWVFVFAILLMFNYHQATGPVERQYDVAGHLEYLQYLHQFRQLPEMKQGWETFQPPVYYWLSVGWLNLGNQIFRLESWRWLQLLAGSFYLAAVALATLAWHALGLDKISKSGLLLFAFLPAQLFLSARINNDVLLPFLGVLIVFVLQKYLQTKHPRLLVALGLCLAVATLTKISALSLVAGTGQVLLWFSFRNRDETLAFKISRLVLVFGPTLLCLLLWGSRSFTQTGNFFYSNTAYLPASQRLENDFERYLFLDVPALLSEVQFNTYRGQIRASWPTTWVASAVYGEFDFKPLGFPFFAWLPAVFAVLCIFAWLGYLLKPAILKQPDQEGRLPWIGILFTGSHAAFLLAYNWVYPYTSNQDFRLWAPVFFPLAILWTFGYHEFLSKIPRPVRFLGQIPKLFFLIMLVVFYLALLLP